MTTQLIESSVDVDEFNPSITEREAATASVEDDRIHQIPLDDIQPDPHQPRDEGADYDLGASVKANGVLQPITVRRHPQAGEQIIGINMRHALYMIVDGERRFRGAQAAKLLTIPARIVENADDDGDRLLRQVLFNEGKRLKPLEEARSWKRIMTAKGWKIQQLAAALGKPKSTVSDRLAMLDAPAPFQPLFMDGTLSSAAAPIVRAFANVRTDVVEALVEHITENYEWTQATEQGKSVPLDVVESAIAGALNGYPYKKLEAEDADFEGETFEVKGDRYAVDRRTYYEHLERKRRETQASAPKPNDDWQKRQAEEDRKRRLEAERATRLRHAQIAAIAAKLPTELNAEFSLAIIEMMLDESHAVEDLAALLGITTPETKSAKGFDFDKAVSEHAKQLDERGRQRMILQIALSRDMATWSNGRFLNRAATILGIDLKKVKAPAPAAVKKAKLSSKES